MKTIKILFFFAFITGFVACSPSYNKEDITLIDEKLEIIDKKEQQFQSINQVIASEYYKIIMDQIDYIKKYPDTLSHDEAMFFTQYKDIAKRVKKMNRKSEKIETELVRTRKQLLDLKETIINGANETKNGKVIDANFLTGALREEILYADQLIDNVGFLEDNVNHIVKYYPIMKPKADSLITVLENKLKLNE